MATVGHGPSQSSCKDCYGVGITTNSSSLVQIQLTGRFAYEGIMLLVKDKHTNKTLGEFQNFDESLFAPVACDDDEDEQDRIEPDSVAVLGHIDSKLKHWPVHVGWNMVVDKPITDLKLIGMIVIDYENFHLLPETEFKIKRKVQKVTTTSSAAVATHTEIQVEHEAGTFVQQVSNELFIWVLSIILTIYVLMSTCFRQLTKRKTRITKKNTTSLLQDDISLVTGFSS
ncbi:uncharacterized protein EV154DRAFT_504474 [Mucor mucedo]|uniref:uncharacterized protein n=1 Tax=Mucor mucedo TaxID=29922 RepID=UPI00221FDE0D|nr:uncharacterized protein EV154DRAFT_504474 [Mucor mucedo]KAI7892686.1 hypothetical protein EV154DRAFT_504474 [Mucor mucedo]